mgnify:CR=1 FL=1
MDGQIGIAMRIQPVPKEIQGIKIDKNRMGMEVKAKGKKKYVMSR